MDVFLEITRALTAEASKKGKNGRSKRGMDDCPGGAKSFSP